MPDVSYTRVNWANYPSTSTKISAANLNNMDLGIKNIFDMTYSSFYNTKAAADADISNIPSGAFVYTDDSTDVLTATQVKYDDGTAGGTSVQAEVAQLNADLTELSGKVGNGMKCAMFGKVTMTASNETIDISSLNLASAEDYMVILNGDGCGQGQAFGAPSVGGGSLYAKTATSFTIKADAHITGYDVSYQVITFK